jgi:serine/threonine protein kinase
MSSLIGLFSPTTHGLIAQRLWLLAKPALAQPTSALVEFLARRTLAEVLKDYTKRITKQVNESLPDGNVSEELIGKWLREVIADPIVPPRQARFQTEAQAIARLQHPNIVQVHEVDEYEGKPFFSLEFYAGGSLTLKLSGTSLPAQEAATLVETLARAMQATHDKNIIHRDLKPANVLLVAATRQRFEDRPIAPPARRG